MNPREAILFNEKRARDRAIAAGKPLPEEGRLDWTETVCPPHDPDADRKTYEPCKVIVHRVRAK